MFLLRMNLCNFYPHYLTVGLQSHSLMSKQSNDLVKVSVKQNEATYETCDILLYRTGSLHS